MDTEGGLMGPLMQSPYWRRLRQALDMILVIIAVLFIAEILYAAIFVVRP